MIFLFYISFSFSPFPPPSLPSGQYWTSLEEFPKTTPTKYYLHGGGTVSPLPPVNGVDGTTKSTSFVYDPANTISTVGG
jgi:predicted acyl esterase